MDGMKTSFSAALALAMPMMLGLPGMAHAGMYKWVDAKGVTHYGDNPDAAEAAKAAEFKPKAAEPAAPAPTAAQAEADWQARERDFKRRQMEQRQNVAPGPPQPLLGRRAGAPSVDPNNPYYRGGAETDASRCNLARDILSGAATRGLKKTDANDREVAGNDVRTFCKR
jgi:hypothetical protein